MSGARNRWRLWIPLAIVVVTTLAYLNAFTNPFLFDDLQIIVGNPDIRHILPVVPAPRWLVNLTFKINYATGQLRVADYHATNLLVHIAAALVLFGVVRRTLSMPRCRDVVRRRDRRLVAGAIAGLWAVHPLQTQSVTYICQRYESLMGLCCLLTLYTFIRGVHATGRHSSAGWFGLAGVTCLLGMGAKEIMVMAPLLVLLYDACFVSRSWSEFVHCRLWVHLVLWLTLAVFALQTTQMLRVAARDAGGVTLAVSPYSYFLTQMEVIPHYLRLSVLPYPLCIDYAWPFVQDWRSVIWPGMFVVLLGLCTVWQACRRRTAAFLGLWFFGILAPTSSVVSLPDAAFEYRMYLPLAAVITGGVLAGYWLLRRIAPERRAARGVSLSAVLGCVAVGAVMTHQRNQAYGSAVTMWQDVVATRPANQRARLNLSSALLSNSEVQKSYREAAIVADRLASCAVIGADAIPAWGRTYEESVLYRDARYYAIAQNYMGVASIRMGDRVEAERHFAEAVRLLPQFKDAADNLRRIRRSPKKSPAGGGAFRVN